MHCVLRYAVGTPNVTPCHVVTFAVLGWSGDESVLGACGRGCRARARRETWRQPLGK